ncbi:MAG TPA: ABC transporter ATP-binding protein [Nocardioidaceae bacterium]|nr:ABC transporter ATP-binding protein [Nocardioidaceae bacterium]
MRRSADARRDPGVLVSGVRVCGLTKAFGPDRVLDGVDLDIANGEILAVLGPSGCGKTTVLRVIAGFLSPDSGAVRLDGTVVAGDGTSLPPQRRHVGYVPQEGALFPHLDVRGNILFGLPRRERTQQRLTEMLDLAELPADVASSYPHELSGGQQQRVALARALAPRPQVVLLDEPFSSLDASLRLSAGREVVRLLRAAGTTAVLVTHDQGEALSLADRVAVMREGRIVQVDAPADLYRNPVDVGVATFVGGATLLPATLRSGTAACALGDLAVNPRVQSSPDGQVTVLVRPEQVRLLPAGPSGPHADVKEVAFFGSYASVSLRLRDGVRVAARVPAVLVPVVGASVTLEVVGTVGVYR